MSTAISQTEELVTLVTASGDIEGTLVIPATHAIVPLAIIIAGSGPTDRDGNNPVMKNNSLKMLADGLAEHGIATVRYDKRGVGQSAAAMIPEADLRFENYVNDAKAWVEKMKWDERFSKITVIGHSEGALIGLIASQDVAVSKCVSIAGAGMPANNLIREQLAAQPAVVLEQANPILETLERGETVDSVPQLLYSLFRPDIQSYLISWFSYNPQQEIGKLDKPVLIIQGTTDIQVSEDDARLLAGAQPAAEQRIFDGMNHIMKEAPEDRMMNIATYSDPDLPLADGLVETIAEFVNRED